MDVKRKDERERWCRTAVHDQSIQNKTGSESLRQK